MTIGKKLKDALKEDFFAVEPAEDLTTGSMIRILREKNGANDYTDPTLNFQ